MSSDSPSIFRILDGLASKASKDGYTLQHILSQLGDRAFGTFIFFLAIPCCIPFLYIIPQIVSFPLLLLSWQMVLGTNEPWIPDAIGRRRIDRDNLKRIAKAGYKWLGWVEKITKPRIESIIGRGLRRIVGLCLCIFSISIMLPIPATNTVPGYAIAIISCGMIGKDGLSILLGLLIGWVWTLILVFTAVFTFVLGLEAIQPLLDLVPG